MTIKDLSNYPGNIKENIKDKSGPGVKIKSYNTTHFSVKEGSRSMTLVHILLSLTAVNIPAP